MEIMTEEYSNHIDGSFIGYYFADDTGETMTLEEVFGKGELVLEQVSSRDNIAQIKYTAEAYEDAQSIYVLNATAQSAFPFYGGCAFRLKFTFFEESMKVADKVIEEWKERIGKSMIADISIAFDTAESIASGINDDEDFYYDEECA
jgi:hypothetical protein